MNEAERMLSSIYDICFRARGTESDFQATKCDGTFGIGFRLRTHCGRVRRLHDKLWVILNSSDPDHRPDLHFRSRESGKRILRSRNWAKRS